MKSFSRLNTSYVLTVGESLMPAATTYSEGAVAILFPTVKFATQFIEANRDDIESLGMGTPGYSKVDDPWKLMRRAAGEGLAGLQSADQEYADSFMFMLRVEEAGADLPTVLAECVEDGIVNCLTRTGVRALSHAEVLHWARYDIIDRVSARWGVNCPFRHWDHGAPLYELATKNLVVLLAEVPLMGDWNSTDGAFAFFTTEEEARYYHARHLANGRNRMIALGKSVEGDPALLMASLKPVKVSDLAGRLRELKKIMGTAAWCINPSGHRGSGGFGRFWESNKGSNFQLRTVAGNWRVLPGNHFEKTDTPLAWTGSDTLFWSGGQSIQLLPLDVSFGTDPIRTEATSTEMTEVEAEEWVADFIAKSTLEKIYDREHREPSLNGFFVKCWDSVTGDVYEPIPEFNGFLEALQFLAAYERDHDANFRLHGAVACSSIGFTGTGDEGHEALCGERFHRGLILLGKRHLLHGYRPSYARDLVAMVNATIRTIHIDFAGYAKDLLWSSDSEAANDLLDTLGIEHEKWYEWRTGADALIDPIGKELVIERIDTTAWGNLDRKVQYFLSTALCHLEIQGHAPQRDYAPISIEIVKGLEVELGNVLEGFREFLAGSVLAATKDDNDLAGYIYQNKKMPTMGSMSYILRQQEGELSPLRQALHDYIKSLPNAAFLTSNRFTKRDLQKVINNYRNGGAHDSAISEATCRSCVETLIGTKDCPGLIPRVAEWKARP